MSAPALIDAPAGARPFLKWAGGKRQLLRELRRFVPAGFTAYHEPFLGSGAVFFDLWRQGALAGRPCRLTDINADLVGCYRALAGNVEGVVRELRRLAERHAAGGATEYYRIRDEVFNPRRQVLSASSRGDYPAELAAMFIYLNRTGYNGLFRLNARGDFNVPAGRYANPQICDEDRLRSAAAVLRDPLVTVEPDSFAAVAETAKAGDFVYFDPPYAPLSKTARFTRYTTEGFGPAEQQRLRDVTITLARRGCYVTLSNSTAPEIASLYDNDDVKACGLRCYTIPARRAINSNAQRRGIIQEYIITNVDPFPEVYPA